MKRIVIGHKKVLFGLLATAAVAVAVASYSVYFDVPLSNFIRSIGGVGGGEYSAPTEKEKREAEKAIKLIKIFEPRAEENYFDPDYHAALGLLYAYAFKAHTDNSGYMELNGIALLQVFGQHPLYIMRGRVEAGLNDWLARCIGALAENVSDLFR